MRHQAKRCHSKPAHQETTSLQSCQHTLTSCKVLRHSPVTVHVPSSWQITVGLLPPDAVDPSLQCAVQVEPSAKPEQRPRTPLLTAIVTSRSANNNSDVAVHGSQGQEYSCIQSTPPCTSHCQQVSSRISIPKACKSFWVRPQSVSTRHTLTSQAGPRHTPVAIILAGCIGFAATRRCIAIVT